MGQTMSALCYTNYSMCLVLLNIPKSFCKKGEPRKHFAQKTVKMKTLKLFRKGIVKWILGK